MTVAKFASAVESARLCENDRIRFVQWVDTYRTSCRFGSHERIPVDRESLITFLRGQKSAGRKTWQRLQIVKAVECYRNTVLVQELLGHEDVKMTMIYTHVLNRPEISVKSPLDRPRAA